MTYVSRTHTGWDIIYFSIFFLVKYGCNIWYWHDKLWTVISKYFSLFTLQLWNKRIQKNSNAFSCYHTELRRKAECKEKQAQIKSIK